jgi:hypothetical protein
VIVKASVESKRGTFIRYAFICWDGHKHASEAIATTCDKRARARDGRQDNT